MTKKQNLFFNFIFILGALSTSASLTAQEVSSEISLVTADSLFKEGKYTESFELYDRILIETHQASPQMLMKMAFIKEGLGDYSQALVYLNKYYLLTSDKSARGKMEDLAEEYRLQGYQVTDSDFFIEFINRNYLAINITLIGIAILLLFVVIYRKFRSKSNATPFAISLCVFLLLLFFTFNFQVKTEQVIITDDHVYLMDGPSSGSDLIDVVKKGHRLALLEDSEVWVKVKWNDSEAFIKKSKVQKVL